MAEQDQSWLRILLAWTRTYSFASDKENCVDRDGEREWNALLGISSIFIFRRSRVRRNSNSGREDWAALAEGLHIESRS